MVAHFRNQERKNLQKKGKESVEMEAIKDGVTGEMRPRGMGEPETKNQVTKWGKNQVSGYLLRFVEPYGPKDVCLFTAKSSLP